MKSIVFGARGMVGSRIVQELDGGDPPWCVSRHHVQGWIQADLTQPDTLDLPKADVVFCATNARVFAKSLPAILRFPPRRVVVITSTSVFSKTESKDQAERQSILELVEAEKQIELECERCGVEWTILRPTLIYDEGRDRNITQIAQLIRTLRFMPLYGKGMGLRQPLHAEDLARGAVAAARQQAATNRGYCVAGLETLPYREMVGRIFDAMGMPRRLVSLPPLLWKAAFLIAGPLYPGVTSVMGERMAKDLAFDSSAAAADFGWRPRKFLPVFQ
jgi:nucleoside-diphosphate-sugar epimerase